MGREGLPNLTREEVLARLAEAGHSDASELAPFLKQSVWLRPEPTRAPGLLESRIGGPAMVLPDFEWPYYSAEPYLGGGEDGTYTVYYGEKTTAPLTMIAQINLAEVPLGTVLPSAGLFSFFTDPFDGVRGDELADRSGFQITFTPAESMDRLEPREMPDRSRVGGAFSDRKWPQYAMGFYLKWCLSDPRRLGQWIDDLHDREPWSDVPDQVNAAWQEITGYNFGHFLLDAGLNHQSVPREVAALRLDRVEKPGDDAPDEAFDEYQAEIGRRAAAWSTLFSITKDAHLRPNVSDTGGLSFLVRKDDLAALRFDRGWIVRS